MEEFCELIDLKVRKAAFTIEAGSESGKAHALWMKVCMCLLWTLNTNAGCCAVSRQACEGRA